MNKILTKIKFLSIFLIVAVMCISVINVQASMETYTITFRPGNAGYFAISSNSEGSKQNMAQAVAKQLYGSYEYEVTKNGAIKVTVSANAKVPAAPVYIQAETGYFVKDASVWGPSSGQIADRNMDFVVDYGKLVNGVEYTVKYVDSQSGESIAPVMIAQANVGENRTETAPKQIIISEGTVYHLVSEESMEKVLKEDSAQNVFTFRYTMQARETIEEEIVNYVDGPTITTKETVTIPADNKTTIVRPKGGNVVADADNEDNAVSDNANDDNRDNTEDDETTIEKKNVSFEPFAFNGNDIENAADIGKKEVSLVNAQEDSAGNTAAAAAGTFGVAAATALAFWVRLKRKKQ